MAVFGLALWVLQDWLRGQSYRGLVAALAAMPWAGLGLHQVARRFGDVAVVDGVSPMVGHREFFPLLGPSGCGKTTPLRLVAGFKEPDAGVLLLDGRDLATVPAERRPVHTVFQSYALFPHMTVAQNAGFALRMARVSPAESGRRVGQAPEEVVITFVHVTHDQGEALALSQRIAVMNRGRIEQVATPESIYRQPANRFVADFIGQCNLLAARVAGVQGERLWLVVEGIGRTVASCAQPVHRGQRGTFALRPGVWAGVALVFVPALRVFAVPDLVGGTSPA